MRHVLMLFVVVGTLLGATAAAVVVTFPDANLESEVRDELRIPAPTPITDTNMDILGTFLAYSSSISNIQGLEYGTNLTYLNLNGNQISDISAVSGLTNLEWLHLRGNQIETLNLSN